MYHRVPITLLPDQKVLCAFREERVARFGEFNLMGKIAELDVLILQRRVLCTPTAIFQGVNRPLKVPQDPEWYDQEHVIVPVCRPGAGACMSGGTATPCAPPPNSVFIALLRRVRDGGQKDQIRRILATNEERVYLLFWWEWVNSDPDSQDLPDNHGSRFREKWAWP